MIKGGIGHVLPAIIIPLFGSGQRRIVLKSPGISIFTIIYEPDTIPKTYVACRCASKERLVNSAFRKHIQTFYIKEIEQTRSGTRDPRSTPQTSPPPPPPSPPKGLVKGLDVEAGGHLPVKIQAMQSAWIWMMWFNSAFSICQLPE